MSENHDMGQVSRALGWGLLVGSSVGFTLGILFAPEEGSRLRRRVKFHLEELAKQAGSLAENMKSSRGRKSVSSASKDVIAKAHEQAQVINSQMKEIMDSATSAGSES